jgi:hypothetical protein
MLRTLGVIAAAIALSGCVGQRLENGLRSLIGQPISVAANRLGYPDGEREILGDKIYFWSTSHSAMLPMANTTTTTGMVGGTPVYGQTTGMTMVPVHAQCTIQLAVDSAGLIKSWQYRGNPMGCRSYASALNR